MKQLFLALTLSITTFPVISAGNLDGKSGKELLIAVAQANRPSAFITSSIGTNGLWHAFASTDRNDDGSVHDRFSAETRYFSTEDIAPSGLTYTHIAPSYWWDTNEYKLEQGIIWDLYNIIPCDLTVNDLKGHYIPGIPNKITYTNGIWSVGDGSYNNVETVMYTPPKGYEGDFARVIMYMAIIYPYENHSGTGCWIFSDDVYPGLSRYSRSLLLQWAQDDPVDDIERARNNAVEKIQGNRNPFVDNPELIDYLWGSKSGEIYSEVVDNERENLKAVYSLSTDRYLDLYLPYVPENAQWTIDGTFYNDRIDISTLSIGTHEVKFSSDSSHGKLLIEIKQ